MRYLTLLRQHPPFTRIWIAQVISLFGDWFTTIALLGLVSQYTNQSGLAASGLLIARSLPPFLVSPVAGVLVDRFDRKKLLVLSDVLRAVVGLSLFLVNSPERLWIIYVVTVIQFSLSALFEPARSALVPNLLPAEHLLEANSLSNITWSVMLAVGALIGGVVTALFGTTVSLMIDVASFALSAYVISTVKVENQTHLAEGGANRGGGFLDGLRYVRANPEIAAVLLVKAGLSVGSSDTIMNAYATTIFVVGENGAGSLGICFGAFGLGAILGPLVLGRFNDGSFRTMRRLLIVSFAMVTLGWFLVAVSGSLLFLVPALMVRAMGGSATWTYSSTMIQMSTNDRYMGRVFSLDWLIFYMVITVSIFMIGAFLDTHGKQSAPQITLIIGFISTLPLLFWIFAVRWLENRQKEILPSATA